MKQPAVESTFDVAQWFCDTALNDSEYLQPLKMQRLLFLAQAYFAVANNGQMLLPSVFIADDLGPLEPNVYRVFEHDNKPYMEHAAISEDIRVFLDSIWRHFGSHSGEYLSKFLRGHPPYFEAREEGKRSVISHESIIEYYSSPTKAKAASRTPIVEQVLRPRVMRSHTGRPVSVKQWILKPKKK